VNFGLVTLEITWLICVPFWYIFVPALVENQPIRLRSTRWHSKTRYTIGLSIGASIAVVICLHLYKFGWLLSSDSGVDVA